MESCRQLSLMRSNSLNTLIIGLGNPILTDDGVGVRVAEAVDNCLPKDSSIDVTEVSVGGLTLMESMIGYDQVILIDAIQQKDGKPGNIYRMGVEDLGAICPTQHSASPHDTNLITALELGKQMGLALPKVIVIYAIQVENVTDFGEELTPCVALAIPQAVEAVLEEIKYLYPNRRQNGIS